MYHYLKDYIQKIDDFLDSSYKIEPVIVEQHLVKIHFFQHERQIHLYVTIAYALFLLISIFFAFLHPFLFIISIILICFLIPYVIHYFHLENGVQYLYKQYDKMIEK